MLGKHPLIKKNKNAVEYRYCTICKSIISDNDCSSKEKNLCKVCAGEVCMHNEMHPTIERNGMAFCTKCGNFVRNTASYHRWINRNIKVDEAQIIYL